MEDIYGHVIEEESSFSYSTLTYVSSLGLVVYDHVGLYNADAESITLPVYHGDIDSVDFDLHRLPIADFVANVAHTRIGTTHSSTIMHRKTRKCAIGAFM